MNESATLSALQQRLESLYIDKKYHWFVRSQTLSFTVQLLQNSGFDEPETIWAQIEQLVEGLFNLPEINKIAPSIQKWFDVLVDKQLFSQLYRCQNNLIIRLYQVLPGNYFNKFILSQEVLLFVFQLNDNVIKQSVLQFMTSNENIVNLIELIEQNWKQVDSNFIDYAISVMQKYIPVQQDPQQDDNQTMILLKNAQNLVGDLDGQQFVNVQSIQLLEEENRQLKSKLNEYEQTISYLQEAPQNNNQQITNLKIELEQLRQSFQILLQKYQNSRQRENILIQKINEANNTIKNFQQVARMANTKYQELKVHQNQDYMQPPQEKSYYEEYIQQQKIITKLTTEKQQLSEITKKLIAKLNSK